VRRRGLAALAGALALCLAGLASAAGGTSAFTVRHVDVTGYPIVDLVVEGSGAKLPPVYENGRRVQGLEAQNLGRSKAIVLAVDRSTSMAGSPLAHAAAAAARFVARKPQSDLVSIVTFGSTALMQAPLSQATIDADTALRTLTPDGVQGTALYDAVVVSTAELASQTYPGRVLILLTDGRNVRSLATYGDAVRSARRAGVVVYAIALGHAYSRPLRRLARSTGGSFYTSDTPAALAAIYRRIGSELDRTWRVSYTTGARPGDTISVSVGSPKGGRRAVVPGRAAGPATSFLPHALLHGAGGLLLLLVPVGLLFFLAVHQARRLPRSARIKRLVRAHTDPRQRPQRRRGRRPALAAVLTSLDRPLSGLRQWKRVERLVETAGVPLSPATVTAGAVALGLLLGGLAAAAGSVAIGLVFFLLGAAAPFVSLRVLAARRIRAFEHQLPDVLTTIAGSLKVGHGLKAALQTVAQEGAPPISDEFRRVLAEERLGRPLEDALVSMCERLASDDLLYVASAVDVHSQVGGSVAGVFSTVAETVRQRQQHRRRVQALSSMGRATARVLAVMPFVFVIATAVINPGYMMPFLRSTTGHLLIAYAILSVAIGFFVLNRMVNVEE
jgi:tight adherence protein B